MAEPSKVVTWWITNVDTDTGTKGEPLAVEYKDGEGKTGTKKTWDDDLKPIFIHAYTNNLAIKVTLVKSGNYWNIGSATLMKDEIPIKEESVVAKAEPKAEPKEKPAPQAVGMFYKEVGDHLRQNTLKPIFGADVARRIGKAYKRALLDTLSIPYSEGELDEPKPRQ